MDISAPAISLADRLRLGHSGRLSKQACVKCCARRHSPARAGRPAFIDFFNSGSSNSMRGSMILQERIIQFHWAEQTKP
jgi:hypothetical protein